MPADAAIGRRLAAVARIGDTAAGGTMAGRESLDVGVLDRLVAAAAAYRDAYAATEEAIAAHFDDPESRLWVFNLAEWDDEDMSTLHPAIQRAERRRRQARVALHAVAELLALENPAGAMELYGGGPPAAASAQGLGGWASAAGEATDERWMRALDRFVGIVNGADAGACIYLDGTFVPVEHHDDDDLGDDVTQIELDPPEP